MIGAWRSAWAAASQPQLELGVLIMSIREAYALLWVPLSTNPPKRWAVALTPGMKGKGRRMGQARFQ